MNFCLVFSGHMHKKLMIRKVIVWGCARFPYYGNVRTRQSVYLEAIIISGLNLNNL